MRARLALLVLLASLAVTGCHKKKGGYFQPTPAHQRAAAAHTR
jgi:hypothetical protein